MIGPWVLDDGRASHDGRFVQCIHIILFLHRGYAWLSVIREVASLLVLSYCLPFFLFDHDLSLEALDLILICLMHNPAGLFLAELLL